MTICESIKICDYVARWPRCRRVDRHRAAYCLTAASVSRFGLTNLNRRPQPAWSLPRLMLFCAGILPSISFCDQPEACSDEEKDSRRSWRNSARRAQRLLLFRARLCRQTDERHAQFTARLGALCGVRAGEGTASKITGRRPACRPADVEPRSVGEGKLGTR